MKTILLIMIGLSSLLTAVVTNNTNDIVTDSTTGLEWQNNELAEDMQWNEAIGYCEGLELGNHDDWRLPNINELNSLVDYSRFNPSIDNGKFTSFASNYYWSSTTRASNSSIAWIVRFSSGFQDSNNKDTNSYVRCVRAGQ